MNTSLRTILAVGFILLAGLPVGYSVCFVISRVSIQYRMREEMKSGELTTLILEKNDLHWMEEGRELLINGRMFDIVKMRAISQDQTEVTGLYDDAETELYGQLNRSLEKDETNNANTLFPFIYYQLTFDKAHHVFYELNAAFIPAILYTNFYTEFFPPVYLSLHLPPPKA